MYHVLILVVSVLTAQPVGVAFAPGDNTFSDEAACSAAVDTKVSDAQHMIDAKDATKGKFLVLNGKCFTDDQIDKMKNYKEQGAANDIGAEKVD